jgi:hypothetical protein
MRAINIRRPVLAAVTFAAALVVLAGCNTAAPPASDRAGYLQSVNRYYQGQPMCLWPDSVKFPVEDASPAEIDERGFNALADAGLLIRTRSGRGGGHNAARGSASFDLSPEGRAAFNPDVLDHGAGNFCYGRRKVVSIDSARDNSTTTALVDYHYTVAEPASWARENIIQSAFPQIVSELASQHQAEVTLLDTTEGWEVSGSPASIAPMTSEPHNTLLAKAKSLWRSNGNATTVAERSSF